VVFLQIALMSEIPSAAQIHSPPSERPQQFLGTTEVIVVWWCELLGFEVKFVRKV
jgi:hypothetical protein